MLPGIAAAPSFARTPAPVITGVAAYTGKYPYTSAVTVSGTSVASASIAVYRGATLMGTTAANGSGNWSLANVTLLGGDNSLTATATAGGRTSAPSAPCVATYDIWTKALLHLDGNSDDVINGPGGDGGETVGFWNGPVSSFDFVAGKFGQGWRPQSWGFYLTTADNPKWTIGNADFTIDFWYYHNDANYSEGDFTGVAGQSGDLWGTDGAVWFYIYRNATDTSMSAGIGDSFVTSVTGTLPPSGWAHIALVRKGTDVDLFINGVSSGVVSEYGDAYKTIHDSAKQWIFGQLGGGLGGVWNHGAFDEFRISIGIARWTPGVDFTPPSSPYPG